MICNVEVWRTIDNFPMYEVSNKGRVRSWKNNKWGRSQKPRLLKLARNAKGYPRVQLTRVDGKKKSWFVHKAVLTAFVGPRPFGMQCCHGDGNPQNNCIENLRYDTIKNNHLDKKIHGTHLEGDSHGMSKLTSSDVLAIVKDSRTQRVIAAEYGVSQSQVNAMKTGRTWSSVTGIKYQQKRR